MAMSTPTKSQKAIAHAEWVRQGSLNHRFIRWSVRAKRTCLVCGGLSHHDQHHANQRNAA